MLCIGGGLCGDVGDTVREMVVGLFIEPLLAPPRRAEFEAG